MQLKTALMKKRSRMGKNVLIRIEYDGTNFSGWQIQPRQRTVQGEIEHVLKYIAMEDVHIHGTSRTDAGVHALGQCASFEWNSNMPVEKLPEVMNRRFGAGGTGRSGAPGDIRILSAEVMDDDFHARYSCKGKTYRYIIDRTGDIFRRNLAFQYPEAENLDTDAMKKAASYITGTHDFKCFETAGGTPRESTVRTVSALDITSDDRSFRPDKKPQFQGLSGLVLMKSNEKTILGLFVRASQSHSTFLSNLLTIASVNPMSTLFDRALYERVF